MRMEAKRWMRRIGQGLVCLLPNACILVNKGVEEARTIPLAVLGLGLIYFALRLLWKNTGNTELPAWIRFSTGLLVGILLFTA